MINGNVVAIAQQSANDGVGVVAGLIYLAIMVFVIAGIWKAFEKAGQPGWGILIPIYNIYLMCKIAGRPGWWVLLFFVPIVNFVIAIIMAIDIAKSFGKGVGFGLGLAFLGVIFWPILGFGSAQYQGPAAGVTAAAVTA
jgi:uncharacterized membrane protein YhaH (DUF805 family)